MSDIAIKSFLVREILDSVTQIVPDRGSRDAIQMINIGSGTIYLGGPNVAGTAGWPLAPGADFSDSHSRDAWYGIAATGTVNLFIIEYL